MIPTLPSWSLYLVGALASAAVGAMGMAKIKNGEIAGIHLTYERAVADAVKSARAQEARYQTLKDEVETGYVEHRNEIDAAYARGLKYGRLRDKGGSCKPLPADSAPTGDPEPAPAGCELSEEASRFLRDLARDADLAAAYAQAGHRYANGLIQ